jgi:hypothetical protein
MDSYLESFFISSRSFSLVFSPSRMGLECRVTKLGDCSPIGRLFTLGRFFENYGSSPNFWPIGLHGKS